MTSRRCVNVQRNAWLNSGYGFMRQRTEAVDEFYVLLVVFFWFVQVDSYPDLLVPKS